MDAFAALLAFCAGNSPVTGEFLAQRPVTRSFDVVFDLCPKQQLANSGDGGDLRRNCSRCDVIVMEDYATTNRYLGHALGT